MDIKDFVGELASAIRLSKNLETIDLLGLLRNGGDDTCIKDMLGEVTVIIGRQEARIAARTIC